MTVAGTVFLDQTTNKGAIESDGNLGNDEKLLYGIEVSLYESNGSLARLAPDSEDPYRTNPTLTNENGYYEFRGVDPFKKYYVIFKYNGIEYKATSSARQDYNSAGWAVSSKGAESSSATRLRDDYKNITANKLEYSYQEIEALYIEIANYRWSMINSGAGYPSWDNVKNYVINELYRDEVERNEVRRKLEYIEKSLITARAGYSSEYKESELYPHSSLGTLFMIDDNLVNTGKTTAEFSGMTIPNAYPGQRQIHLGLVKRDVTDLELTTDIVDTTVSMNGYDTIYNYGNGKTAYHQYIYKEDYNYETDARNDGIAYYSEDNVHFYVTYESTIRNSTLTPTALTQIVDYCNSEFNWKQSYNTTKTGVTIPGFKVLYYENASSTPVDITSSATVNTQNVVIPGATQNYKANYVNLNRAYSLSGEKHIKIQLTYELVGDTTGDSANAKAVLAKYLLKDGEYSSIQTINGVALELSNSWKVGHYSEITGYATEGGYLDRDSHPGNFNVTTYESLVKAYQEAYEKWYLDKTEENARNAKRIETKMTSLREDDAFRNVLELSNSSYSRVLKGNVWEAIDDTVKSSLELQDEYGERYVKYDADGNKALGGIKVELVELLKNGENENGETQIVRAVTRTNADGSYEFKSYIAGDYTVRFVYGDYDNTEDYSESNRNGVIKSKVSTNTYENEGEADYLPINGQYYQSTKANPNTDTIPAECNIRSKIKYWYYNSADKNYRNDDIHISDNSEYQERYSDAYDDSYTRLTQMNAVVVAGDEINGSTSSEYNYDANINVQTVRSTDPIYAYTSTMELEIEYVRPSTIGNKNNKWYKYDISNVDFGLTPRAYNDVNISRYVSNIKLYTEGGTEALINVDFDQNGNRIDNENTVGKEYIGDTLDSVINYKDGIVHINYEELLAGRAHLELTYEVIVSNDSKYDEENKIYDKIKYIYENNNGTGKIVGVVYYNEETSNLVNYETRGDNGVIMYHNAAESSEYSTNNIAKEYRNQNVPSRDTAPRTDRIKAYALVTNYNDRDESKIITSTAKNIVDYPMSPLDFTGQNYKGETINVNWIDTKPEEFVSSRENYKVENGEIDLLGEVGKENSVMTQSHILKATPTSPLYSELKPGDTIDDKIVLQHTLSTTSEDINGNPKDTDLTGLDIEYSNLVEITRLNNTAGKIVDTEGYDITGEDAAETSKVHNISDIDTEEKTTESGNTVEVSEFIVNGKDEYGNEVTIRLTPTLCTGKSQTTVITPPAGLPQSDSFATYAGIALVTLIVFAGGIVLIKKYVVVAKPKA